jgi:hypothetical protein
MKATEKVSKNLKKRKFSDLDSEDEELKESFKTAKNPPKRVKQENLEDAEPNIKIDTSSAGNIKQEEQKGNN